MWYTLMPMCLVVVAGCTQPAGGDEARGRVPDEWPKMVNAGLPFHYPGSLYTKKLRGNVTLRLFIDVNGFTVADSTRVAESSGQPEFDSAAVAGAKDLRFIPAKAQGVPTGMTIHFPVYFRHPEAPALAGDSILRKTG